MGFCKGDEASLVSSPRSVMEVSSSESISSQKEEPTLRKKQKLERVELSNCESEKEDIVLNIVTDDDDEEEDHFIPLSTSTSSLSRTKAMRESDPMHFHCNKRLHQSNAHLRRQF